MRHRRWTIVTLASCLLVASACSKSEPPPPPPAVGDKPAPPQVAAPAPVPAPFRVVSVDLGKQLAADKKVAQPTTKFAPSDTIYASVATEGAAPSVALKARWTYGAEGQLVNESAQTIAPTGPANTEFHIAKPSGWPSGNYKVEISANDKVASVKEFSVD